MRSFNDEATDSPINPPAVKSSPSVSTAVPSERTHQSACQSPVILAVLYGNIWIPSANDNTLFELYKPEYIQTSC